MVGIRGVFGVKRYYVTATWHDFPEGGSFGTIVQAENYAAAEHACMLEMAQSYASEIDEDPTLVFDGYSDSWTIIDCFDVDEFIEDKRQKPDDIWAEDENHSVAQWQYEVENDDTRLGYWDWVNNQRNP
jgi:hypothetical protein